MKRHIKHMFVVCVSKCGVFISNVVYLDPGQVIAQTRNFDDATKANNFTEV